jgi:hypothetical protein
MSTKNKQLKIRLNLQIDKKIFDMINIMREKHYINISSLCRKAIVDMYNKLEKRI